MPNGHHVLQQHFKCSMLAHLRTNARGRPHTQKGNSKGCCHWQHLGHIHSPSSNSLWFVHHLQTSLWVMASRADSIQVAWVNTATWAAAVLINQPVNTYWTKITLPPFTPTAAGTYQLQINMAGALAGTVFYVDDVTVMNGPCSIPVEMDVKQAWWKQV